MDELITYSYRKMVEILNNEQVCDVVDGCWSEYIKFKL